MSLLKVEDLTKTYTSGKVKTEALRGVNMIIDEGEFTAVVGPSGSGKTTLVNIIGGLDIPNEGYVYLKDREISKLSQKELSEIRLRKIGFIFQAYNLIPVLTALENVEYVMLLQGIPKKERYLRSREIMEEVGIGDLWNKRPNEMSGGQQQRVAVARAIVAEPMLVLADEPTANLDSKTGETLLDLMKELNEKKRITFIFSTHDKLVMDRARRIVTLKDGIVVDDTGDKNRITEEVLA
jgi:putative ABC transport system ATP-binding protein